MWGVIFSEFQQWAHAEWTLQFLDLSRAKDDFYLAIVLRQVTIILQAVDKERLDRWATMVADMMDFNPSEWTHHLKETLHCTCTLKKEFQCIVSACFTQTLR